MAGEYIIVPEGGADLRATSLNKYKEEAQQKQPSYGQGTTLSGGGSSSGYSSGTGSNETIIVPEEGIDLTSQRKDAYVDRTIKRISSSVNNPLYDHTRQSVDPYQSPEVQKAVKKFRGTQAFWDAARTNAGMSYDPVASAKIDQNIRDQSVGMSVSADRYSKVKAIQDFRKTTEQVRMRDLRRANAAVMETETKKSTGFGSRIKNFFVDPWKKESAGNMLGLFGVPTLNVGAVKDTATTVYKKTPGKIKEGISKMTVGDVAYMAGVPSFEKTTFYSPFDTKEQRQLKTQRLKMAYEEVKPKSVAEGMLLAGTAALTFTPYPDEWLVAPGAAAKVYRAANILKGGSEIYFMGEAGFRGAGAAYEIKSSDDYQKLIKKYSDSSEARMYAMQREESKIYGETNKDQPGGWAIPFTKRYVNTDAIKYQMSLAFSPGKDVYEKSFIEYYTNKGVPSSEIADIKRLARYEREKATFKETAGLVVGSAGTEIFGRRMQQQTFAQLAKLGTKVTEKKSFGFFFRKTAKDLVLPGFGEGFTQELIQQKSRTGLVDYRKAGVVGGIGAVSAPLIGGTIAGLAGSQRKGLSKAVEYGAYITDWSEKPGDLFADVTQSMGRVRKFSPTATLNVNTGVTGFSLVPSQTTTKTDTKRQAQITEFNRRNRMPSLNDFTSQALSSTFTDTSTDTDTDKKKKGGADVLTGTSTWVNPFTNVPTIVDTNTNINTDINTPVNTNILTNVNIPVITPQIKIPPPVPLGLGLGGSGKGKGRGKGVTYLNELAIMGDTLGELFRFPGQKRKGKKRK